MRVAGWVIVERVLTSGGWKWIQCGRLELWSLYARHLRVYKHMSHMQDYYVGFRFAPGHKFVHVSYPQLVG